MWSVLDYHLKGKLLFVLNFFNWPLKALLIEVEFLAHTSLPYFANFYFLMQVMMCTLCFDKTFSDKILKGHANCKILCNECPIQEYLKLLPSATLLIRQICQTELNCNVFVRCTFISICIYFSFEVWRMTPKDCICKTYFYLNLYIF